MAGVRPDLDGGPLAYEPPEESRLGAGFDPRYPLELVSSKAHDGLNSSFGMLPRAQAETAVLEIHPEDAAARGIRDGMTVEVFNQRGAIRLTARVGDFVRPGVVRAPWGRWPATAGGANVNLLIADRLTDIGGGPTFYNCLVEVRRCES
jgi:anaerobic selenocysteine-containing dehydrogenase